MSGQALYRKWRSQTFEEVIGQEHVALTLRNALREGRISHAYLFTGPRGTGKTSTARILAKAINCLADDPAARPCNQCHICRSITEGRQLDLIEIDAASNRGIDEIRDLREKIGFRPNEARYKVYIIDEVHMLTKEAFNALLKTLEEPPSHAVFVLATTEPDRVPETVRSRCQRFDFRRVPTPKISEHLAAILASEGAQATPEALMAVARRSTGSMRDAISLLDQLLSYGDDVVGLTRVQDVLGLVDAETISRLVDSIADHDSAAGLTLINQLVANGVELGELVDQILAYLRAVLFVQMVGSTETLDLSDEVAKAVARQAEILTPAAVLHALREYAEARTALRDQVPGVPQLPVEIALVRSALPANAQAIAVAPVATTAQSVAATAPPIKHTPDKQERPAAGSGTVQAEQPREDTQKRGAAPPDGNSESGTSAIDSISPGELVTAVQQNWDRILETTHRRGSPMLKALFQTCRQMDASENTLILRFEHDTARKKLDEEGNRITGEKVLQEVLGRPIRLQCALLRTKSLQAGQQAALPPAGRAEDDDQTLLRDARNLGAVVKRLDKG